MKSLVWMFLVAVSWSTTAIAQVMVSPAFDQPAADDRSVSAGSNTFVLHPQSAPDPLLRHRLWPAPQNRLDHDPMPWVSRALILMQSSAAHNVEDDPQHFQWNELPLDQYPVAQVRESLGKYRVAMSELDRIENAMKVQYDLGLDQLSVHETIGLLLPEFQDMRVLSRLLETQIRVALVEQRYEDAIRSLRVGFRLAQVAARSTDLLVGRVIGISIAQRMMNVLEVAVQQPGFPNMYWALAALPRENLFEVRDSIEFESTLFTKLLPNHGDLPPQPIGQIAAAEALQNLANDFHGILIGVSADPEDDRRQAALMISLYVASHADSSRQQLALDPVLAKYAADFSGSEAVLRTISRRLISIRDQWLAWQSIPLEIRNRDGGQPSPDLVRLQASSDLIDRVASELLPQFVQANYSQRADQQLARLITLEALRMHVAHSGELPESLSQLEPVPAWHDAVSGQPFDYRRIDPSHAVLTRVANSGNDPNTKTFIQWEAKP
ncbi:hypothetical protein [Neorhodopirellula lusitana]|uniref:hypothetical protein n=1 Tax=Neorhodopirellula lusitana TaxID=445327 RepID=UPI00384A5256